MMKYLLILFLLFPAITFSQKDKAAEQIKQMKDGVLLVRLMTRDKSIAAMQEMGKDEQAARLKEEQHEKNLEIAEAFKQSFTFCPVYFFYSGCSKEIRERQFQGCLMDSSLEILEKVPPFDHYFISEFWHVERNQDKYYQNYTLREDTSGYKTKQNIYYGDTELGPDALIIRDSSFIQLRHPFPFYIRTYEGFPLLQRKKPKAVKKLDEGLNEFYQKVVK
jgi:hypothetical protein